jgi:hypothetical protein
VDRLVCAGTAFGLIGLSFIRYNYQPVVSKPGNTFQITVHNPTFIVAWEQKQLAIVFEQIFQTGRLRTSAPNPHS